MYYTLLLLLITTVIIICLCNLLLNNQATVYVKNELNHDQHTILCCFFCTCDSFLLPRAYLEISNSYFIRCNFFFIFCPIKAGMIMHVNIYNW
jgi:hypothetical protein